MSDLKISQLTAASTLGGTEQVPVNQSGTKRTTIDLIKSYILSALGSAAYVATTAFEAAGAVADGIAAHVAASDPHTQYLNNSRGDARYDALGAASSAITAHTDASDPHTQYLTESAAAATYSTPASTSALIFYHTTLDDPHSLSYYTKTYVDAHFQVLDATLTALAAVTTAAGKFIYATGSDTFATCDSTSYGRSLLNANDAAALQTLAGLGSFATRNALLLADLDNLQSFIPQGRLSGSSTDPEDVNTSSITTIYYHPFRGNQVCVPGYNTPNTFKLFQFTALSRTINTITSANNSYDLFLFVNSSGVLTLGVGPAWTNSTTRGYNLSFNRGLLSNASSMTLADSTSLAASCGIYVGSFRTTATAATTMLLTKLYLRNYYNRIKMNLYSTIAGTVSATVGSWIAYTTGGSKAEFEVFAPFSTMDNVLATTFAQATTCYVSVGLNDTPVADTLSMPNPYGQGVLNYILTIGLNKFTVYVFGISSGAQIFSAYMRGSIDA